MTTEKINHPSLPSSPPLSLCFPPHSLYLSANAGRGTIERRSAFSRVPSRVRSCPLPRSAKRIRTVTTRQRRLPSKPNSTRKQQSLSTILRICKTHHTEWRGAFLHQTFRSQTLVQLFDLFYLCSSSKPRRIRQLQKQHTLSLKAYHASLPFLSTAKERSCFFSIT